MKLIETNITETFEEIYLIETLNLDNKRILELGCGAAKTTKQIASNGFGREIDACEVDLIQHNKNIEKDIENITFHYASAQELPFENETFDIVFMFKSFHHIPINLMSKALEEIKRVLKPNGLVYISEPLFMGDQNKLLAMFHDEEDVRLQAFFAIEKAVENNKFKLFKEVFFQSEITYENFDDFKRKQMNQTFNDYKLDEQLIEKVQIAYDGLSDKNGKASFLKPFRVDILQKI